MMKSGLERMLNTELDIHQGRRSLLRGTGALPAVAEAQPASELVPVVADEAAV